MTAPTDAKRVPYDVLFQGILDINTAKQYAWTTVTDVQTTSKIQTEEGMNKGKTCFIIKHNCPNCNAPYALGPTPDEHGEHPIACSQDRQLIHIVKW